MSGQRPDLVPVYLTVGARTSGGDFTASWIEPPADGVVQRTSHYLLRHLMDHLEERFDR